MSVVPTTAKSNAKRSASGVISGVKKTPPVNDLDDRLGFRSRMKGTGKSNTRNVTKMALMLTSCTVVDNNHDMTSGPKTTKDAKTQSKTPAATCNCRPSAESKLCRHCRQRPRSKPTKQQRTKNVKINNKTPAVNAPDRNVHAACP
jgi:hypothetical protein